MKIKFMDGAFKDVPEEDREGLKEEITKLFEGDPSEIGEPVLPLPDGAQGCPNCGGKLECGPTFPVPDGEVAQIFDCLECDSSFLGKPLN